MAVTPQEQAYMASLHAIVDPVDQKIAALQVQITPIQTQISALQTPDYLDAKRKLRMLEASARRAAPRPGKPA